MQGYTSNIESLTASNSAFRQVLYTSKFCQLVIMSLQPTEDIGDEVHEVDQFFRFESGEGKALINGVEHPLTNGSVVIVPAGSKHNIINTSATTPLKLYTLYCPPHHADKIVHETKSVAALDPEHFTGQTSE